MADEVNTDASLNIDSAMPDSSDEEFDIPSSEGEEDNQEWARTYAHTYTHTTHSQLSCFSYRFEYNHTKVMEIVNKIEVHMSCQYCYSVHST